ncbi:MAG: TonB-dependent receptor [Saprospiraceae bacterium]
MKSILTTLLFLFFALPMVVNAQSVSGTISDAQGAIIGGTVAVSPTGGGTTTDVDGKYSLDLSPGTYKLTVSYTGYDAQTKEFTLTSGQNVVWDVTLNQGSNTLADVVIVGSRTAPRSSTTSPLPVDVFRAKDLVSTGQTSFDKALQYRVPSFNTVQTPVNDATALLDPYEIRNMGPSRTLILINGKRKNMSALLYTQTSPGRGETGADISGIPTNAIKRIEILRDGASAQYGSDAIAGVMNIIMKDDAENGSLTLNSGITSEGDGANYGIVLNNGAKIGKTGFVNYTMDLSKIELSNRPGTVDAAGEAGDFGADIADVQAFLNKFPDAGNINGSPETTAAKFAVNAGVDISENTEMYGNAAYIYKKVNSFANYRTPYWRTLDDFPYLADFFPNGENGEYIGYVPTFDGDLNDYNATIGFKNQKNGWITDVSFTTGGNEQTYIISNSHNRNGTLNPDSTFKYRENSPLIFDPGGTRFVHQVGNIDVTKRVSDKFGFAFGSEFRSETFTIIEGSVSSYEDGGPDSFAGNDPRNSGKFNRYNFGAYLDGAFDLTDDFLINGTVRLENYSDFGNAFVWKVSSRYKMNDDKVTLRASASTGFKAPSLHQIYTQKAQYSFIPGQGIQVGGLVSNVSREARLLGLPDLDPEKSTNITVGVGLRLTPQFSLTVDYYNIAVTDRIILSSEIGGTTAGNTSLDAILADNNLSDLSFFVNALDTRTSGIDFVAGYRGVDVGTGKMNFNLSGNITLQNEREGDVKDPSIVQEANAGLPADEQQSVSNATQEALFFTSRPVFKIIFGVEYNVGKFGLTLNNTVFGPTKFKQQGLDADLYTEFETKVVTDLGISYQASEKVNISLNVNNLLNVLPEWSFKAENAAGEALMKDEAFMMNQSNLITFNQRYSQMTYDGYHFSQLGTILNAAVNIQF